MCGLSHAGVEPCYPYVQGGEASMLFWVTPLTPGRSRIIMHVAISASLPAPIKLLVRHVAATDALHIMHYQAVPACLVLT